MSTFFGLRPDHRPIIHSEIFDLIFFGNGGFTFSDVYEMPIFLRKFYLKKLSVTLEKQQADMEAASKKTRK